METAVVGEAVEAAAGAEAGVEAAPALSKNAQKRLLKASSKESRKLARKAEKKIRKAHRSQMAEEPPSLASVAPTTRAGPPMTAEETRANAWVAWRAFGSPRLVLAPMVNQSELAFRLLAREHGAGLTYTPMLHSTLFATSETYRRDNFDEHPSDRPLVVQFCGDDPDTLLSAARYVEARCDVVDLNCGCPQAIARRGHYGAFLLDEPELIEAIVRTLSNALTVPVSVKVRVLPAADGSVDTSATVRFAQRLEAAGASLLTVHGRTRAQKCACTADWSTIRAVKEAVRIPVIANGGVERPEDLEACLQATGCDGVMTSEGALENPALLAGSPTCRAGQAALARSYAAIATAHPPKGLAVLKAHFFKLLYMALDVHRDMREKLGAANDATAVFAVVEEVCEREDAESKRRPDEMSSRCDTEDAQWTTWYRRHRGATEAPSDRYGSQPAEVGEETCVRDAPPAAAK